MVEITQETRCQLGKRELLALECAKGHLLVCESGEVWITQEGCQEDFVLGPGQSWRAESGAALVVSALQPTLLVIINAAPATPRIALHRQAESILALLQRWKHPPLASYPATLLR